MSALRLRADCKSIWSASSPPIVPQFVPMSPVASNFTLPSPKSVMVMLLPCTMLRMVCMLFSTLFTFKMSDTPPPPPVPPLPVPPALQSAGISQAFQSQGNVIVNDRVTPVKT